MMSVLRMDRPESTAARPTLCPNDAVRLFAPIARLRQEVVAFAYFDPEWRLLGLRHRLSPATDMVLLSPRDVARDALAFDARLVVMAHNHPSGDPRPSADDIAATRSVARLLDAIETHLVDHLVLAGDGCTSLRRAGLI